MNNRIVFFNSIMGISSVGIQLFVLEPSNKKILEELKELKIDNKNTRKLIIKYNDPCYKTGELFKTKEL